jgi:hypothetical protein
MDTAIIAALIGLVGTVAAAVITAVATRPRRPCQPSPEVTDRRTSLPQEPTRPGVPPPQPVPDPAGGTPPGFSRLRGFSYDRRQPRDLDVFVAGDDLVFHQHPPGDERTGDQVRVSLAEARTALRAGERVIPAVGGVRQVRFRLRGDPAEPNEVPDGEVVVDSGKWWVCVPAAELQAALERSGVAVRWA